MSATETIGMARVTGASAGIGAIYAAAKVASLLAARAENALLSAPILPSLLRLTLPSLAAMLVVALAATFETVYVGILGTTSLAAIALVFPLIMLMQMLSAGAMGGGVSSAISRALGAGDLARAEALALHAVVIGAAAGLAFSAIFVAFGVPILRTLGGSGAVLGEALVYTNIALAGAILTWLLNTFASVLRGTGNMRVPSLTLIAASGLQMMLGGGLGLGIGPIPRLGLAGVATGLIVAYALATLFLFWFLRSGRGRLRLKFGVAALKREMFFDILKVGAVSSVGSFQVVLTVLILTRLVALILDAHASIAFLAGSVLDLKSGVEVELIQKGRVGSKAWRADDGSATQGKPFNVTVDRLGTGADIAVAVSISHSVAAQAQAYIASHLPNVGALVSLTQPAGPSHQAIAGGGHAAGLAEQVSNTLREIKAYNPDALVHIFAACPNSFLFFLGQQHQGIAPCIVYEFDFDRQSHKTYQPSFVMD